MIASLATVLIAASSALALPHAPRQTTTAHCIGAGTFATGGPFNLFAYDKSEPSAGGVLLSLSPSVQTTTSTERSLATSTSFHSNETTSFNLTDGGLVGSQFTVAGLGAFIGGPIEFRVGSTDAADIYCGIAGTDPAGHNPPNPLLSVYGDADNFHICTSTAASQPDLKLDVLVYRPNPNSPLLYDFATCRLVSVELVSVDEGAVSTRPNTSV